MRHGARPTTRMCHVNTAFRAEGASDAGWTIRRSFIVCNGSGMMRDPCSHVARPDPKMHHFSTASLRSMQQLIGRSFYGSSDILMRCTYELTSFQPNLNASFHCMYLRVGLQMEQVHLWQCKGAMSPTYMVFIISDDAEALI